MLILTGDAHANPVSWYDDLLNIVDDYNGTISLYIAPGSPPGAPDHINFLDTLRSAGHDISMHPYQRYPNPPDPATVNNLYEGYEAFFNWWDMTYDAQWDDEPLPSRTIRNHQVAWAGWADIAETASITYGIRMDTSYYHYGAWIQKPDLSWPMGYITGSGQPMKFVKEDGEILDIYQLATQLVDEHMLVGTGAGWMNLTYPQAITASQQLIDSSLQGDYAALMAQFHVDYASHGDGEEWARGTMQYAFDNDVPIWSADKWLTFTETRYGSNFNNIVWTPGTGTLTFDLDFEATSGVTMTLMVPNSFKTRDLLTVEINSVTVPITVETIKGVEMAFVEVPDGVPLVSYDVVAHYSAPTAIALRSFAGQVSDALHTDAAATLLVLLGSATLVFLLERRRRATA